MQYFLTFLEGFISFISPCMLPMLPIYISYFAAGADKKYKTFVRAISFVLGFTTVFTLLGLFAGTLGSLLVRYETVLNIICGVIVIIFGLSYMEVIHLPFLKGINSGVKVKGVFSAFLFGVVYSISHTPCVGAFLGAALSQATSAGKSLEGMLLLLVYSLGLGIPFILSALLIDQLQKAFAVVKKHHRVINIVCGIFLIVVGLMMAFGLMHKFIALFE
ncbi:MAG: cytochrome c biogenesis protein CcdA [Ruminococcaceae bacterium]|nr:cytochrome c biogenesis protein CcdA [Oscillospiraceae bacterium]